MQTTEAAKKDEEKGKGTAPESEGEAGSPEQEWETTYAEAMREEEGSATGDTGTAQGADKDAGTAVKTAPAGQTAKTEGDAAALDAEKRAKEDADFLASIDMAGEKVSPQEMARLRKVHGKLQSIIDGQRGTIKLYGEENTKLSGRVKDVERTMSEIRAQQSPADRMKGVISKIDVSKLSRGAQRLLNDPEMQEVFGVLLSAAAPGVIPGGSDGGREAEGVRTPLSPEDQEKLDAWAKEQSETIFKAAVDAGHADIKEKLASKEFADWLKRQPMEYRQLLMNPFNERMQLDPTRTIRVLNDYRAHTTAIEAERQAKEEQDRANDALRTHGGGAGPSQGEGGWRDPMDMSPTEFAEEERRIQRQAIRGG